MSHYPCTTEIKLRISQIEKRLGELSSIKEKIAFKSLRNEDYSIIIDYNKKYGANSENQYLNNKIIAISDIDKKVKQYDSELSELRDIFYVRKIYEDEINIYDRSEEIERIKLAERNTQSFNHGCVIFGRNGPSSYVQFAPSPLFLVNRVPILPTPSVPTRYVPNRTSDYIATVLGKKSHRY